MSKQYRNMLLLIKIQPTPGVDSVPVVANAILARGLKPSPLTAEFEKRNNVQAWMGNQGSVFTACHSELEFEVEFQSSGTAGTAPAYDALLRACALSSTNIVSTSQTYQPVTTALEAVSIYVHIDGVRYNMLDCKGSVAFSLNSRGIPVMRFKFLGLQVAPTDTAVPGGAVYTGFIAPLAINFVNTPVFTLHAIAVKAKSLEIDLGNEVAYRNIVGSETVVLVDRNPTGTVVMELDTVAVKDWTAAIKAGTLAAIAFTHGLVAGNIMTIACPKVQILDFSLDESDGITMVTAKLDIQPNAGNDEFVLVAR